MRSYVFARTQRELQAAKALGQASSSSAVEEKQQAAVASSPAAAAHAPGPSAAAAASSNPMYGFGSKLTGAARKAEARRMRGLLAVTKAEQQPISALFSDTPTRQLYLLNGGASCGVSYDQCHALLRPFGPIMRLSLVGLSPFALVEFESLDSAIACEAALDGKEWHRESSAASTTAASSSSSAAVAGAATSKSYEEKDRQLFVQYAQPGTSSLFGEGKHPLQLANARPLEEVSPQSVVALSALPSLTPQALASGLVPGLLLVPDFLSESEETSLLSFLDGQPWDTVRLRQMQHYGFRFDYRINDVDRTRPLERQGAAIPQQFEQILKRMEVLGVLEEQQKRINEEAQAATAAAAAASSSSSSSSSTPAPIRYTPDQLTVNRYGPGDGIPAHVDTHSPFTDIIVSISLGARHVMEFVPTSSTKALLGVAPDSVSVPLPPRSLLALTGAARYGYTHAISARRTDRISNVLTPRAQRTSLTFRQLRAVNPPYDRPHCSCAFSSSCDSNPAQVVGEGAAGASVQLKRRDKSTFGAGASKDANGDASASPSSASSSASPPPAAAAASSSPAPSASPPPPSSPAPLSPELEECHRAACAAGLNTYTDPQTGYSVFTRIGLEKARKGVCCGNACRHCPYQHVNVPAKQALKASRRR